ncbi:hypothetical protein ACQCRM_20585, partial [Ralstonia pseudosolanacearum]
MLFQHGLDFAGLDAEAADLDLVVVAAEVFDAAVGQPAAEVAGAVHPRAGLAAERVGQEAFGGQLRPVQVAARDARAADADWTKWSVREAIELFARHHLSGPV